MKTGADEGAQDMKKEVVLHEMASAMFSALREEEGTTMSKLVKEMAPCCSIYTVDFRNLVTVHALDFGQDLSAKLDFILTDPQ